MQPAHTTFYSVFLLLVLCSVLSQQVRGEARMLALLKVSQGHCFVTGDGKQEEGSLPLNSAEIRKTLVHTGMSVLLQSRQVYLVCDRT